MMSLKKIALVLVCFCSISGFSQVNTRPGCDGVSIPESVSICGDGIGNTWRIYFPCTPEKFSVTVYNQWGVELYTSTDPKFQWSALDKDNKPQPSGVYVYALSYTLLGDEKTASGNVTVICE